LYGPYTPDSGWNRGHVNDPKLVAMLQAQRRTKDPEARKQILVDFQRYAAEQQYYVYLFSGMVTSSWQPYVQNYAPNLTFDYGSRVASLWLERYPDHHRARSSLYPPIARRARRSLKGLTRRLSHPTVGIMAGPVTAVIPWLRSRIGTCCMGTRVQSASSVPDAPRPSHGALSRMSS